MQQPHRVGYACRDPDAGLDEVNDGEDAQRSHHAACTKAGNGFGPSVRALLTDCVMLEHFSQRCVSHLPRSKNVAMRRERAPGQRTYAAAPVRLATV